MLTESMLCDNGASMMQARSLDVPGFPVWALRAGGGDESTVSRLGRFSAGGVMVVPAKTTGASRMTSSSGKNLWAIEIKYLGHVGHDENYTYTYIRAAAPPPPLSALSDTQQQGPGRRHKIIIFTFFFYFILYILFPFLSLHLAHLAQRRLTGSHLCPKNAASPFILSKYIIAPFFLN